MPTVSSKPELCLCVCVCSITSYLHSSWSYFMRFRPVRRYQHLHIICARKWKAEVSTGAVVHRHCCDRAGRGGRGRKVLGPINKPVMRAQSRMVMRGEITCCIREKERERRGSKGGGDHARPCMIYCGDRNMRPCVYVCVCVRPVTHDSWSIDFCFHCDPAEPGSHHRCTVQRSCHSSSTSRGRATHTHVADTGKASRASLDRPCSVHHEASRLDPPGLRFTVQPESCTSNKNMSGLWLYLCWFWDLFFATFWQIKL